jgi:5'-nucleotidase
MTQAPRTILVDMDGVLADFQSAILAIWEAEHPHEFTLKESEVTEHDMTQLFPPELRDEFDAIALREGFFRSLPPIEGGREALTEMQRLGLNVRICTAPKKIHRFCVPEKYAWIEEHLGGDWTNRMVMTRDKTLVAGDILIDDKPCVTGSLTPTWTHVLYDQTYNRSTDKPRLTWQNWKEVLL